MKNKHNISKKFGIDFFGSVLQKGNYNKLGKFLQINVKQIGRDNWSKNYKKLLKYRKRLCIFYGDLKIKELMRYCQMGQGNTERVISFLERRLCVVMYRLNFVTSVLAGKDLVKRGKVLVNGKEIVNVNYLINKGDLVEIVSEEKQKVWENLLYRVKTYEWVLAYPKYYEVDYSVLSGILLKEPQLQEIYCPFEIDADFFFRLYSNRLR